MSYLRNDKPLKFSESQRMARFSILTVNPLIKRKKTHDSEVSKYRGKLDERYPSLD